MLKLIVLFILLLLLPGNALAAKRGLILLGNFRHWADLYYDYDAQTSEGGGQSSSSKQHRFEEDYHFGFDYAVYHPRILLGHFAGDVKTRQQLNYLETRSTSGEEFDLLYRIGGTFLEKSPYPVSFVNALEYTTVQQEFSSSYDMKINTNGFGLSIGSKFLPVTFSYSNTATETSGLPQDRNDTNEVIHFTMSNAAKGISNTSLNLFYTKIDSVLLGVPGSTLSRAYDANLQNTLSFTKDGLGRAFATIVQLHQQAGSTEYSSINIGETLNWTLGKALTTTTSYSYNNRNSPHSGTETSHQGNFLAQHRFVQSLTTQLQLNARKDDLATGDEQEMGGTIGVSYQKKLPQESQLSVSLSEQYTVTERSLTSPEIQITDEPHKVVLAVPLFLNNPNVVASSVVVTGALHPVPFVLGSDYSLIPFGAQTQVFILPGSQILDGDDLLVTYIYEVDPQIKYATTTHRATVDLPLFNRAYRFYGRYIAVGQELQSGQSNITHLADSQEYILGVEFTRARMTYGAEYGNYDSDTDKHEYYDGHARITRNFGKNFLSFSMADRYTINYPNSFTVSSTGTIASNTLSTGVTYNRPLFGSAQLLMTGNYIATRGDILNRDNASVTLNVRWNYGKLQFSLSGQSNWLKVSGSTSRDDHLRLKITRYF